MSAQTFNEVIVKQNYKKYLEIGLSSCSTFNEVNCELKHGVDPGEYNPSIGDGWKIFEKQTSDMFFENCTEMYDIIYIDGYHECEQALRDINNSIQHLNENGIIFIHDTKPHTELMQRVPMPHQTELCDRGLWTGDVWKAIAKFRSQRTDFSVRTFDIEIGLTILQRGHNQLIEIPEDLTYEWYLTNQDYVLNLIPYTTGL
jgi:hypothetical protein